MNNGVRDCHVSIFAIADAVSISLRRVFGAAMVRALAPLGAWWGEKTIVLLLYGTIDARYFIRARRFNPNFSFVLPKTFDFGSQA